MSSLKLKENNRMAAATERVKNKTDYAVAKERRKKNGATKTKTKGLSERPDYGVPIARENISSRGDQESMVVVIEDGVAAASEIVATAVSADARSVQITGYVESQRSRGGRGARQEE